MSDKELLDWLSTRHWSFTLWPDRTEGRKRNLRAHIKRCMKRAAEYASYDCKEITFKDGTDLPRRPRGGAKR